MHIVITGATGYIGAWLLKGALARGWSVTVLGRTAGAASQHVRHVRWSLGEEPPAIAFQAFDAAGPARAVLHLAHDWTGGAGDSDDINPQATERLLVAARDAGADRFVFASTASARPDALNRYGRVKARIEALLTRPGELAARIGMVYGGPKKAMWGTLCRIATLAPVIPMISPHREVQPVHIDDLCEGLLRMAELDQPGRKIYPLADAVPVTFGGFLKLVAAKVYGRPLAVVPLPLSLVLVALDVLSRIPFLPKVDKERVYGLAGITYVPSADALAELGLSLRPLADGLAAEMPMRRMLLAEAACLLAYVAGRRPSAGMMRRYVRAVLQSGDRMPLALPGPVLRLPALMRLLDPLAVTGNKAVERARLRLHMAALLADTERPAQGGCYDYEGQGRSAALVGLVRTAAVEGMSMPIRLLATRLWWR